MDLFAGNNPLDINVILCGNPAFHCFPWTHYTCHRHFEIEFTILSLKHACDFPSNVLVLWLFGQSVDNQYTNTAAFES